MDLGGTGAGVTGVWTGLLDDAAIFPPGEAPLDRAVPAHQGWHRSAWYADLVGPFVVTDARWPQVVPLLHPADPLPVSLIAPLDRLAAAAAAVLAQPGARLAAVEVPPAEAPPAALLADLDRAGLPAGVPVAVEVPRDERRLPVLDALAGSRYRVKLRTGGTRAEAFPPAGELAAAVLACHGRGLAFKATAGLHHAVRHDDPATGFAHHGFLNVLLAAAAARDGAGEGDLAAELDDRDATKVAGRAARVDAGARELFTSFGTCSIADPVADLVGLGLLTAPARETIAR